uniref:Non-structural maintenance of chromosomes element 1 homolog n=1 Tax=Erythrolobus australicus TaxID=1077150 RepID=A0A7S1XJK6_9RHOD|mmetsp:Transcript_4943/g.13301  ORF Transcript_4943/g.13301 Transcript_4943/m.13301 type:complete len:318 (+) Transcript_4943:41-994(+)
MGRRAEAVFYQALCARGCVTEEVAVELFNACVVQASVRGEPDAETQPRRSQLALVDAGGLPRKLRELNQRLEILDSEVRAMKCHVDGKTYYGVVGKGDDRLSKLTTVFSPASIALFYKIIQAAIDADSAEALDHDMNAGTGRVGGIEMSFVQELGRALEGNLSMRPSEIIESVEQLVRARWLHAARHSSQRISRVTVGVRAILEIPAVREWNNQQLMGAHTIPLHNANAADPTNAASSAPASRRGTLATASQSAQESRHSPGAAESSSAASDRDAAPATHSRQHSAAPTQHRPRGSQTDNATSAAPGAHRKRLRRLE